MKFRIISDLHLDGCLPQPFEDLGADVALVAGDSVNGKNIDRLFEALEWLFPEKIILALPGNHEGYGLADFDSAMTAMGRRKHSRIQWLNRSVADLGQVAVLGCTLWTDFHLFGPERELGSKAAAMLCMSDYKTIGKGAGQIITADDTQRWHQRDLAWLRGASRDPALSGKKLICATHHGPRRESLALRWSQDLSSSGFLSHLPESDFEPFALWVHGHTHSSFDYTVGSCRVICNPRGYSRDPIVSTENAQFQRDLIVDV